MEMKIEVIYKENYASILNYVSMKVKDKLTAEDITADVFLKVCTKLNTFNPDYVSEKGNKTSFNTWLHTIANNCIIDKFRKDAKENVQNVGEFVNGPTNSTKLDKCEGIVEFDWLTTVHTITCNKDAWSKLI